MATYREIISIALDILKERSDDSYYTEEHMLFLANYLRAVLLERKYRKSRNMPFSKVSDENKQEICIDLEPSTLMPNGCESGWLKSTHTIPDTLGADDPKLSAVNQMLFSNVTYIPAERMPYVGYNKWLKNIVYASLSSDNYLYLKSNNPQFIFLKQVKMEGVFTDSEAAYALACNPTERACDIMDAEFPLEQALIPSIIEMMVQEITGSRYAPEDRKNNAKDDLADYAMNQRPGTPVESAERHRERYERDAE